MACNCNEGSINLTLKRYENNVFIWYVETENNERIFIFITTFFDLNSRVTFRYNFLTCYVSFIVVVRRIIIISWEC